MSGLLLQLFVDCRYVWLVLLVAMLGVAMASAFAQSTEQSPPSQPQPVIQQKRFGAVRLTLEADRQTMGLADQLRLTLSVEAPPEAVVTFPDVAQRLGPFAVRRQRPLDLLSTVPQTHQWRREYLLEAQEVGVLSIPPLSIAVERMVPPGTGQQLQTDPLAITVFSLLPKDADVSAPKDIAPPVRLVRRGVPPWVWIAAGVLGGCGLVAGGWWWYRYRHRLKAGAAPPQPAHQLALEALDRLQREELIAQQRIEEFYVRLSDIVRHYVEWRFGLHAQEQTTEEFLVAVVATQGLIMAHRNLLDTFLRHCDLVKFARHQPTPDDMQQAWESARAFVEQTADADVLIAASAAGVSTL